MKKIILLFVTYLFASTSYAISDDVLVSFEGLVLTEKNLMEGINDLPKKQKEYLLGSTKQLNEYIDIYYREKIFEYIALKKNLDKKPEFQSTINLAKRQLLIKLLIEDIKNNITVPDLSESAKEYYRVNSTKFLLKEQVEARHILLNTEADNPEKEQVRQRLEMVLGKIKKAPDSFEQVAREISEDVASGSKGGYLGKFVKGQMVKEFEEEAFGLTEKGQLSGVFSSKFGYHIIQLVKKYPPQIAPFKQVKALILDKLSNEYIESEYMRWRNDVVDPKKADVNKDRLEQFINKIVIKNKNATLIGGTK